MSFLIEFDHERLCQRSKMIFSPKEFSVNLIMFMPFFEALSMEINIPNENKRYDISDSQRIFKCLMNLYFFLTTILNIKLNIT